MSPLFYPGRNKKRPAETMTRSGHQIKLKLVSVFCRPLEITGGGGCYFFPK